MSTTYSLYDAKARFSEVMRRVRSGSSVVITYRGHEIAEIRPLSNEPARLARRLGRMEERGVVLPPASKRVPLRPLARRPGALKRFLDERE
jgi:prevent-host-death family protein